MTGKDTEISFEFNSRAINRAYEKGLRLIPVKKESVLTDSLRSCLIHDNSESFLRVKTVAKWETTLKSTICNSDGEIIATERYQTNEIKQSNARKIRALDKFCAHYQPLYRRKKVSLMFHTFTRANYADKSIQEIIDNLKLRYKAIGREVRGYIWTAEISEKLHWHYHLAIAIDRIEVSSIPEEIKLDGLWGQRTGVEFVRKNLRHYMAKYFAKQNARVIGLRSYGKSNKYL